MLLSAIHNLLSKNSIAKLGDEKKKGITNPDFEKAFAGRDGVDDNVGELFSELGEIEFENPDLRKVKRELGRDKELFGMLTSLVPHEDHHHKKHHDKHDKHDKKHDKNEVQGGDYEG